MHNLMMGRSCAFILTKLSDLPLHYFLFFFHVFDYAVLDSGYREASGYVERFDLRDA
jgi:hypothetical protein